MSKTLVALVGAVGFLIAPAIAQADCSGHAVTASTPPPAPIQTAEAPAPAPAQTK